MGAKASRLASALRGHPAGFGLLGRQRRDGAGVAQQPALLSLFGVKVGFPSLPSRRSGHAGLTVVALGGAADLDEDEEVFRQMAAEKMA